MTDVTSSSGQSKNRLKPEKVAYWYFRLNGFLTIENFIVHPPGRGSQRTDADLLAVRFPHRAERLIDDPNDVMEDDVRGLALSHEVVDVVIAEVKTNQPCTLNGPWTEKKMQNVDRVLAAIGCVRHENLSEAASDIYRFGMHKGSDCLRVRLVAVGRERNEDLAKDYPDVVQLTWAEMLEFVWRRLNKYRRQKSQVEQWDFYGKRLRKLASEFRDARDFVAHVLDAMGVRRDC